MNRAMIATMAVLLSSSAIAFPAEADVTRGRELATRLCAVCHLNEGQGEKQGPSGIPGFVAIANRPSMTTEGIVAWLKSAPPMMPNHHLTNDEAHALADYIASLRKGK